MDEVIKLYVADEDQKKSTTLTLPASIYEMMDVMERVGSKEMDGLYFEIEKYHKGEFLEDSLDNNITIRELNILAWKLAEMNKGQEVIFEGLIEMERKKQDVSCLPYQKLLQLAENTDCCHWIPQARNDNQLGRFYAENGFIEGVDSISDKVFELLDFEKIGRKVRLAEGGVFTEDSGYVVQHEELKELEKLPNLDFKRPLYTLLLEVRSAEHEDGPVLQLELPMPEEYLQKLDEKILLEDELVRCTDCAVPFFCDCVNEQVVPLQYLNDLAQTMDLVMERGELPKYKAMLLATGCRDVELAAELGAQEVMAEHQFTHIQGETGPVAYAASWLREKLGEDAALVPDQGLEELGHRLMERENIVDADYGLIQRMDGQPIHRFDLEPEWGVTMTM